MIETKELNKKIYSGLMWTYFERLFAQGVSFFVTILLARLLMPNDYGIVSIVLIFITICDKLVVGGFSDSLIQKPQADNLDFSTLFWFVLVGGFIIYVLLFLSTPAISRFFRIDLLNIVLPVMAVRIPINAIKSIQAAYISRHMKYRYFFFATLWGTGVSAVVGIYMALNGFGVWALVAQYLTNSIVDTIIIWFTCGWHPSLQFSWQRLRDYIPLVGRCNFLPYWLFYMANWKCFVSVKNTCLLPWHFTKRANNFHV